VANAWQVMWERTANPAFTGCQPGRLHASAHLQCDRLNFGMPQGRARALTLLLNQCLLPRLPSWGNTHKLDGCTACYKDTTQPCCRHCTHPTAVMLLAAISCRPPATASRMLPSSTSLLSATRAGASGSGRAATLLERRGATELCRKHIDNGGLRCNAEQVTDWAADAQHASVLGNSMPRHVLWCCR
jgi:hypothetical protein